MKISSIYKSDWLRAPDLDGKPCTLTIAEVGTSRFDDGREQITLSFEELHQKLGINKTNANAIAGMLGAETDDWVGKRIIVFPTRVEFQGKRVDAIRVDDKPPF